MGPKQRKSLSSAASQSYSNSPWKSLTRIELYQVLDQCDIPVSSEKLLKGELIELLEGNLDEKECRKWLEYYEKPLPNSDFGLSKNESASPKILKKEITPRERMSVPAYIAVANNNSDILNSTQGSVLNEVNRSRTLRRRVSMYANNSIDQINETSKEYTEPTNFESANSVKRNSISDCYIENDTESQAKNDCLRNKKGGEIHAPTNDMQGDHANSIRTLRQRMFEKIKMPSKFISSKTIIIIPVLFILFALNSHFYYFFREPNFCNSIGLNEKTSSSIYCIKCPPNGYCKDGKLKCNSQYKKAVKYLNNKWQIVCIYDNEAFDLAEEMLTFITNKLRKLRGNRACSGNHFHDLFFPDQRKKSKIIDFDRSIVLSKKEINDIINLSFNYIEKSTVDSALSIMWNSIKTGNSLSRYGLRLIKRNTPNSNSELDNKDSTDQIAEDGSFIEAIDSEISVICEAKLFLQKWVVILAGIISLALPLYFKIKRRRRKTEIVRKIKAIVCRENKKDTSTGLFVGPDLETILRLLRIELPKYKRILNEQLVAEYCDYLEQNDPNIHKTLLSDSKYPFYWSSA